VTSLPSLAAPRRRLAGLAGTVLVGLAALALVAGCLALLAWMTGLTAAASPPPKNPFGVGLREGGAPGSALAGWILAVQSSFDRQLTAAVKEFAQSGHAGWALAGLGLAYGVFHAAGPGHGKAVISAWILAQEKALKRGVALSLAAAMLQAIVAIALVTVLAGLAKVTASGMTRVAGLVETASFAAVALVGIALLWRKSRSFAGRLGLGAPLSDPCGPDCGHVHAIGPEDGARGWRDAAGVVLAAGIRPCSGAIILLVFALSQGVYAAGIAGTLAMALGTALTTGMLAALAVFAKAGALRLASGRGALGETAVAGLEVLAAAFVTMLGVALLGGLWSASGLG
jgi:ABC-type nickel/cobalt efflux system permease component RcnA